MRILFTILGLVLALGQATAATPTVSLATLNCYWLMSGAEGNGQADKPQSRQEYELKAGHLVGLLPAEAPLFVGFQEIGGGEDLAALARAASARFRKPYEALFVPGRDSAHRAERRGHPGRLQGVGSGRQASAGVRPGTGLVQAPGWLSGPLSPPEGGPTARDGIGVVGGFQLHWAFMSHHRPDVSMLTAMTW